MTTPDVLARLQEVKGGNGQWSARCPAHPDEHPSLSITESGGKVLLYCHAGCKYEDIRKALDLDPGDWAAIEETYDYRDESGKLLYQVVRLGPKSFRQRAPRSGGWEWTLKNVKRRVLYRLPEILSRPEDTVWVVEGEKDADTLAKLGQVATTNAGGAGKWDDSCSVYLRDRTVVILPDNDPTGKAHALKVAKSLWGVASEVKIVELPGLEDKGDVSDWLSAGHSVAQLLDLAASVNPWEPQPLQGRLEGRAGTYSYRIENTDARVSLRAAKLHSDGRLTCILRIFQGGERIATSGALNLSAVRTRNAFAKDLEELCPLGTWARELDALYTDLEDRLLTGNPRVALPSDKYPTPTQYLVHPLVPEGEPTILYGDGESGKSMLAMLLATLVSSGSPHERLFIPAPEQKNCLYLDWERQESLAQRRLYRIAVGLNLSFPTCIYYRKMVRRLEDEVESIAECVQQDNIGFVIVDSLLLASGAAGTGHADPAGPADALFRSLASLDVTSLVVAHRGKDREKGIYGSIFYRNLASCVWEAISAPKPGSDRLPMVLYHRKANLAKRSSPIGLELRFDDGDNGRGPIIAYHADISEVSDALPTAGRILALLPRTGPLTLKEISENLGISYDAARKACQRLVEHKSLVRLADGRLAASTSEECPF